MISTNIQKINSEIKKNCELSGRNPEKLVLIGASKSQPIEKIQEAYEAGLKNFGENYLQEAESKIGNLSETIIWHFIGSIQSRKAKKIAELQKKGIVEVKKCDLKWCKVKIKKFNGWINKRDIWGIESPATLPATYFINPKGEIVKSLFRPQTQESLEGVFSDLKEIF